MQTGGSGAFVALNQTARAWRGMCAAPNGNVYACVSNGDIYMQMGGSGAFVALGQSVRSWYGMCAAPNGNVYASVDYGDIYKQSSAGLYFTDDYVIVTTPNIHNIYQSLTDNNANNYPVNDNVNWLKIGSTNRWKTFNAIIGSQTEQATKIEYILTPSEAIDSVALLNIDSDTVEITEIDTTEALLNETAWTGATGTTQSTGWNKVGTPSDYTIDGGMIRITADAASEGQSKTVAVTPGVEYQLLGLYKNNLGDTAQYGIYDNTHSSNILATTDLPSSTTNASFSHVFTAPAGCTSIEIKQMAKANTDVVWFDSFILAPTKYSETVTTGPSKIDVVKLDIPEISTGILTVVINKSAAAIGELIIGKSTYIGDLQYAPSFGIKDWSTITTDVWGNRIIVPRAFSKWLKCPVCVLSTNMDEINRLMSLYRGVNLLWIANPDYSAMIVYGIYTDYSQTWQHLDFTICNLEIEGLT
jgi:hypothetical protein